MQEGNSRKERIIRWLREHEADLERLKKGKVIFHLAGRKIFAEISGAKEEI